MSEQQYKYWDPMHGIPVPDWVVDSEEGVVEFEEAEGESDEDQKPERLQ